MEEIQGIVEKSVFGGKGLLRHEGLVIFVEGAIPGEEVVVRVVEKKKSYWNAECVRIVTPSPLRVVSRCPHFGVCGGCQLQHMPYEMQVEIKKEWITEFFKRGLKRDISLFFEKATLPWTYRRKVTLHARCRGGKLTLGYFASDNTTLFDVVCCPIFIDEKDPFLPSARAFLESLSPRSDYDTKIILCHIEGRKLLTIDNKIFENVASSWELVTEGKEELFTICGHQFYYSPEVFIQTHPQSDKLYEEILACVKGAQVKSVCDLYCGIGVSTLLLAQEGIRGVVGVEGNRKAITLAKRSAQRMGMEVSFFASSCESWLGNYGKEGVADMWLVNPPREGLSRKVLEKIAQHTPDHLIYISCMPPTLIRDLTMLQRFYEVDYAKAYDLFPQTTHLETFTYLRRKRS